MITASSEQPAYRTRYSDGFHQAVSDVSIDHGGGNTGFNPHQLLEAALAACVNITVRMYAQSHSIPLTNVNVDVSLDRAPDASPLFRYKIEIQGDQLTSAQRDKLLQIAERCPVRRTLSQAVQFERRED